MVGWDQPLENSTLAMSSPLLSARSFGEVNEDASKLITNLVAHRLTAKTDFGKSMSPLISHSRKGGAFPIMQSVPVQACPRMHVARGQAQHLPPQKETLRQTLSTGSVPNSGVIVNTRPKASMSGYALWWQNFIPEKLRGL